jgi:hypothetical protein
MTSRRWCIDAQVIEDISQGSNDPAKRGQGNRNHPHRPAAQTSSATPSSPRWASGWKKSRNATSRASSTSLQFLKQILELAQGQSWKAEKQADPQSKNATAPRKPSPSCSRKPRPRNTHIIVERIVADIDDIVKKVRFPGWQRTQRQGERDGATSELRRTLLKYKLHTDQDLFDKAYGYIRQYY